MREIRRAQLFEFKKFYEAARVGLTDQIWQALLHDSIVLREGIGEVNFLDGQFGVLNAELLDRLIIERMRDDFVRHAGMDVVSVQKFFERFGDGIENRAFRRSAAVEREFLNSSVRRIIPRR